MLILLLTSRKNLLGQLFHDTLNVHFLRIWKGQILFNSLSKVFIHIRNFWSVEGFGCYLLFCSDDISEGQKIRTMKCFFPWFLLFLPPFSPEREKHCTEKVSRLKDLWHNFTGCRGGEKKAEIWWHGHVSLSVWIWAL